MGDVERLESFEVGKGGLRQFLQQVVAHVEALQQLQLAQPFRQLLQLIVLYVEDLVSKSGLDYETTENISEHTTGQTLTMIIA